MTGRVLVNGKDTKDHKVAQLALEVGLVSRIRHAAFYPLWKMK